MCLGGGGGEGGSLELRDLSGPPPCTGDIDKSACFVGPPQLLHASGC